MNKGRGEEVKSRGEEVKRQANAFGKSDLGGGIQGCGKEQAVAALAAERRGSCRAGGDMKE